MASTKKDIGYKRHIQESCLRGLLIAGVTFTLFAFVCIDDEEYLLKANFIKKFTLFIEWPFSSDEEYDSEPFIICVLGTNPFNGSLDSVFSGKKIKNRRVVLQYITDISEISGSSILFISESEYKRIDKIVDYTKNKPVLLIGDTRGYAERGVHINFFIQNEKIRFEINNNAAKNSGLYLDYKLLSLARQIK